MEHEEILTPVRLFRTRLRGEHARNLEAAFGALLERSGVDPASNAALVAEIRRLEALLERLGRLERRWRWARTALLTVAGVGGVAAALWLAGRLGWAQPLVAGWVGGVGGALCAVALTLVFATVNVRLRSLRAAIADADAERDARERDAWAMMEPLNTLFRWDTMAEVTMKTLPILTVDRYLSEERLGQLVRDFGWSGRLGGKASALVCQSGAVNGNPWVIVELLRQRWQTRTYVGNRLITWTERGPRGRTVVRTQLLTASVERKEPVYARRKRLVYGNEAAPRLTFSRVPNGLAVAGGRDLERAIEALDERNRDPDDPFTLLDNPAFDAAFAATDRDDEVQFRLLFTPLAQQETLALMRDTEVGCGDAFTFVKHGRVNVLANDLLDALDVSASPRLLRHYDLRAARRQFLEYGNAFFRGLFFTFAPLFCIPLYQQHRSHADIYAGIIDAGAPAPLELESLVNALGEARFRPRGADTPSLLTVAVTAQSGADLRVEVTASAFHGHRRVARVSVRGGDGRSHEVPVQWVEYLPVSRTVALGVCPAGTADLDAFTRGLAAPAWRDRLRALGLGTRPLLFRRGLAAFPAGRPLA